MRTKNDFNHQGRQLPVPCQTVIFMPRSKIQMIQKDINKRLMVRL